MQTCPDLDMPMIGKRHGLSIHHEADGRVTVRLRMVPVWTHAGTMRQAARRWDREGVAMHGQCRWWTVRDLFLQATVRIDPRRGLDGRFRTVSA